jgi:hypothetical protein
MSADGIEQHVIMGALVPALIDAFFARNLLYAVLCDHWQFYSRSHMVSPFNTAWRYRGS